MTLLRPTLTSLFCSLALLAGTAGARIINGIEAKVDEFPEVFSISFPYPGTLCTATLIHPYILLTSARCLPLDPDAHTISVGSGNDAENPTHTYVARASHRFPGFDSSQDELSQTTSNIGIIVLAEPLLGVPPTALADLADAKNRNTAFKNLIVVGYGGTRTLNADSTTGKKRWAHTHALESTPTILATAGPSSGLSYGDNGGPAYILGENGSRQIIAVASGLPHDGRNLKNGISEVSFYTGISPEILEWIKQTAGVQL